jgi:hypothetical protein
MGIKKSSSIEFYRIGFIEKKKEVHLFTHNFKEYSTIQPFTDDFKTIFNYIETKIDEPNSIREQTLSRSKKHRMWIDSNADGEIDACFVKETQSAVIINKGDLEITLAHDDKLDVELASLSHFVVNPKYKLLALETFNGSTTKAGVEEYLNRILVESNCRVQLTIVPRDDILEVLNDVKEILKFRAKYRDIKAVMPDFMNNYIFSSSSNLKELRENREYETVLEIKFSDAEQLTTQDTLITRFIKALSRNSNSSKDMVSTDEKITLLTNQGNEEVIQLGSNLFIEKMIVELDESLQDRIQYSSHIYENILERIDKIVKMKRW